MPQDQNNIDEALAAEEAAGAPQGGDVGAETVEFVPNPSEEGEGPSPDEQLKAAEDRSLRLQAELQNVLNRSRREVEEVRKYGALGVVRDLLPAIDNIDRALEVAKNSDDAGAEASGLSDGFRMVRDQLVAVLDQHGCKPIETTPGTEFDPSMHEAILQQPSDEIPAGAITMSTQTGFKLHDRVVRAAQVIVSSGPAEG